MTDIETIREALVYAYECAQFDTEGEIPAEEALRLFDEMVKAEPVAWILEYQTMGGDIGSMLSWTRSGAGMVNRLNGAEHEKPLYTNPIACKPKEGMVMVRAKDIQVVLEFNGKTSAKQFIDAHNRLADAIKDQS